ncbi:hypothetical protein BT63DRAFT_442750 [Microthyrium microscopicum]|uniref:DUF7918 domain-containing protein n=1 Tax=Microthyrium microscopicum TaxID=703497 RepID=A0A6A6U145_9PEZI|nr:hypothetical protein BT63DRAFT_442750 [Microthyrium microscopicum]
MAVINGVPGVTVTIHLNGRKTPTEEYESPRLLESDRQAEFLQTTRYIESITDATIEIAIQVDPDFVSRFDCNFESVIYLDGAYAAGILCEASEVPKTIRKKGVHEHIDDANSFRKLKFTDDILAHLTAGMAIRSSEPGTRRLDGEVGEILIKIRRWKGVSVPAEQFDGLKASRRALFSNRLAHATASEIENNGISHIIDFGPAQKRALSSLVDFSKSQELDTNEKPLGQFRFLYRCRSHLQALGVLAPPSHPPDGKSKNNHIAAKGQLVLTLHPKRERDEGEPESYAIPGQAFALAHRPKKEPIFRFPSYANMGSAQSVPGQSNLAVTYTFGTNAEDQARERKIDRTQCAVATTKDKPVNIATISRITRSSRTKASLVQLDPSGRVAQMQDQKRGYDNDDTADGGSDTSDDDPTEYSSDGSMKSGSGSGDSDDN